MTFEERLGLLLDREQAVWEPRRMKTRLRKAKMRKQGSVEDIDFRHPRGQDKSLVIRLADCHWIRKHNNLIITGLPESGSLTLPVRSPRRPVGKGSAPSTRERPSSLKT